MSKEAPRHSPGPGHRAQDPRWDAGLADGVWLGLRPLSCVQVSSYGGTLHYELHSDTQRGDVFVPTESRPDVVLQVTSGVGWRGGQVGTTEVGQDSRQPLPRTYLPPQGNQMSIMFLEPAYPAPGHVHRGRLQLVEVSAAGLGPSCCARSITDSDPGSGRGSPHTCHAALHFSGCPWRLHS